VPALGNEADHTVLLSMRPRVYYDSIQGHLRDSSNTLDSSSQKSNPQNEDLQKLLDLVRIRSSAAEHNASILSSDRDGNADTNMMQIILVPQLLPKFHPLFDHVLRKILKDLPYSVLVMVHNSNKKQAW
jgi:hypothetical protein